MDVANTPNQNDTTPVAPSDVTVQTTLRVERNLWTNVRKLAIDRQMSAQQIVLDAIAAYMAAQG